MLQRKTVLAVALALAGVLVVGAVGAVPADESPGDHDAIALEPVDTTLENDSSDDADMGICMIGADSPCNADEDRGEPVEPADSVEQPNESADSDADMGICMIGADSPCNADEYRGESDGSIEPVKQPNESRDGDADMGVCMIGADSPCNGDGHNGDRTKTVEKPPAADNDSGADVGICVTGVDSPCNGDDASAGEPVNNDSVVDDAELDQGGQDISPDEGDSADLGICVIGADSPCNGGEDDMSILPTAASSGQPSMADFSPPTGVRYFVPV